MKDNSLYELTVDQTHMNIIIRALSNFICSTYNGIDDEVVDVSKAMEEIKVASDIQAVLKHQLGKTLHSPKQTSQHTGLVWCKQIDLEDHYQNELESFAEYSEMCLDTFLKNHHKEDSINPSKAWGKVKERHWDTIKRTGEK